MLKPQTLDPLTKTQLNDLIGCFENNSLMKTYPGRQFALDLTDAVEVVKDIIDAALGKDSWTIAGGNFFKTEVGYRVHADTGRDGPDNVLQTFVFPLEQEFRQGLVQVSPERNRLLILNQTWKGAAAFFLNGEETEPNEYNVVVRDYASEGVIGLENSNELDPLLLDYCPHLNPENFRRLSVDQHFTWVPGIPMTFPRDRLHVSSAFPRYGIKSKLGLSIFTSKK